MAQITSSMLSLLTIFALTATVEPATLPRSRARVYLENQCAITRYPKLCVECLSPYVQTPTTPAGPRQLAQAALMVALTKARFTKAYVSGVAQRFNSTNDRDLQVVKDCLNQINYGVDQITQSIKELRRMGLDGEDKFIWHESNIQSWMSAALTEATQCIDGFSGSAVGGKIKATIKAKVLNVEQLASNALAFFNRFAARHRSSRALKLP